jgi:hypothetical protein
MLPLSIVVPRNWLGKSYIVYDDNISDVVGRLQSTGSIGNCFVSTEVSPLDG